MNICLDNPKAAVAVSRRALIRRVNCRLARTHRRLLVCRSARVAPGPPWWIGDYYIVDTWTNFAMEGGTDLEELGRELGALKPHERLVEEGAAR